MTRSKDYEFDTDLDDPLFSDETEWRTIFLNSTRWGEDALPGAFGMIFQGCDLIVRQIVHEDEFWNTWPPLSEWLAATSEPTGFVGFYRSVVDLNSTLIYFEEDGVSEIEV